MKTSRSTAFGQQTGGRAPSRPVEAHEPTSPRRRPQHHQQRRRAPGSTHPAPASPAAPSTTASTPRTSADPATTSPRRPRPPRRRPVLAAGLGLAPIEEPMPAISKKKRTSWQAVTDLCRDVLRERVSDEDVERYLSWATTLCTEDPRKQETILAHRVLEAIAEASRFAAQNPGSRLARALVSPSWEYALAVLSHEKPRVKKGRKPSARLTIATAPIMAPLDENEVAALLLLLNQRRGEPLSNYEKTPHAILRIERREIKKIRDRPQAPLSDATPATAAQTEILTPTTPGPPKAIAQNAGVRVPSAAYVDPIDGSEDSWGFWKLK